MTKRVRIVDNLLYAIDNHFQGRLGHRFDYRFLALCDRIAGQEVDLIITNGCAYESIDQYFWLPECCWREL